MDALFELLAKLFAWSFFNMDYIAIVAIVWHTSVRVPGIHDAFRLLLVLLALLLWFLLQQIKILRIYIFRIIGSAVAGMLTGILVSSLFFDADTIWSIVLSASVFILVLVLRSNSKNTRFVIIELG